MLSKKSPREKIAYFIPEHIIRACKSENSSCFVYFQELVSPHTDSPKQFVSMQKIQITLQNVGKEDGSIDKYQMDLNCLSFLFLQAPINSAGKKFFSRILHDMSSKYQIVRMCLDDAFQYEISDWLRNISPNAIERSANCLLGILENFSLGESMITLQYENVWNFAALALDYILRMENSHFGDRFNLCQLVLKEIIMLLQNCSILIDVLNKDNHNDFGKSTNSIKSSLKHLLRDSGTTLNCRLNAGIAYCHICFNELPQVNLFGDSECSFMFFEAYPLSSQLCFFSGIMAALPNHHFVDNLNLNDISSVILQKTFNISECVVDTDLLILCLRNLIQWSSIIRKVLTDSNTDLNRKLRISEFKSTFGICSETMEMFFQFVLHLRGHYVDTIRHLSKDLFKNVILLHTLSIDTDSTKSPLLKQMSLQQLEGQPQDSHGKYGMLCCIAEVVGSKSFLEWCPGLPIKLYKSLEDINLVPHITDLLEVLYKNLQCDQEDLSFENAWLHPLLALLCSGSQVQITAINEYVLPKLMKVRPTSSRFLMPNLSSLWENNKANCFCALITCAKFEEKQGCETASILSSFKKAIIHADDKIRLSAFAFVCESKKSTEIVSEETLNLLKFGLPYNTNCQSPSFRQQLVSFMKKIFTRMVNSLHNLKTKSCNLSSQVQFHKTETSYKEFLSWLKKFLFSCLHPGANFPRRGTTLTLMQEMHLIMPQLISVVASMSEVESLLHALQDTYENNKMISSEILKNSVFSKNLDKSYVRKLLETAMNLASSTKPPDTVTASYILTFIVHCDCFHEVIEEQMLQEKKVWLTRMEYLKQKNPNEYGLFLAMILLVSELSKHFCLASESIVNAAACAPIYGLLLCIRSLLSVMEGSTVRNFVANDWCVLLQDLVETCYNISKLVEPVVSNSSPEGYLPISADPDSIIHLQGIVRNAIGKRFENAIVETSNSLGYERGVVLDIVKTHAVTAQILLLCCWRTHKEISLLLGTVAVIVEKIQSYNIPLNENWGKDWVIGIGEYFIYQMSTVKHKGAFEQAYIGFSKFCSAIQLILHLSQTRPCNRWLNDILQQIKEGNKNSSLCSTRRSAGLPFILQAILTTDRDFVVEKNASLLKKTIPAFFHILSNHCQNIDAEVHSLNILRALFRDSCLSEPLMPFVSDALKVSITKFKSDSWAVRNSSTLLFSALMTKVFGVKGHNESDKKNRLTGRAFFTFYKDMYHFLYKELEKGASNIKENPNKVSTALSLYPILLILGKLYPAPGEKDVRLSSFLPFLHICASSPVLKIRVLTAKALVPLLSSDEIMSHLHLLFQNLPTSECNQFSQNAIHGILLQVLYILKEYHNLPQCTKELNDPKLSIWIESHFVLATKVNSCFSTRAAFLEIVLFSLTLNFHLDNSLLKQLLLELQSEMEVLSTKPDKNRYLCVAFTVLFFELSRLPGNHFSQLNTKHSSFSHFIQSHLKTSHYIVQHSLLDLLTLLFLRECDVRFTSDASFKTTYFCGINSFSIQALINCGRDIYHMLKDDTQLDMSIIQLMHSTKYCSTSQGMIYQLLCFIPVTLNQPWSFLRESNPENILNKLEYVLSQLEKCTGVDVFNHMMLFSTQIVVKICSTLLSCQESDLPSPYNALSRWSECLYNSIQPDCYISRRKCTISCFQICSSASLFNCSKGMGTFTVNLWKALFSALIDDEPEIKSLATDIVLSIKSTEDPEADCFPVLPLSAFDTAINLFIKCGVCSLTEYVAVLLDLMLSCKEEFDCNVGDEQPFDKGELNVFAEDIRMAQIVSRQFSCFLKSVNIHHNTPLSLELISYWNSSSKHDLQDAPFCIENVVRMCLSECMDILFNLRLRCESRTLMYMRYDRELVQLCQRLYVISSFCPLILELNGVRDGIIGVLNEMKNIPLKTVFISDVISEVQLCLL